MTLPAFHIGNEVLKSPCYEGPDYIQIRYNGLIVAVCCAAGHTIQAFDTAGLESAKIKARELSEKYTLRVVER